MERALAGGRHLTRAALAAVLDRAGIAGAGQRLAYLVMDAELERVICSGPRLGKQFTYALLEERAPKTRALTERRSPGGADEAVLREPRTRDVAGFRVVVGPYGQAGEERPGHARARRRLRDGERPDLH